MVSHKYGKALTIKRKTPIGDGNIEFRYTIVKFHTDKKKDPDRGRKHPVLTAFIFSSSLIKRKTPIGDGNISACILDGRQEIDKKKDPDRGRKLCRHLIFIIPVFDKKKDPDRGRKLFSCCSVCFLYDLIKRKTPIGDGNYFCIFV